MLRDEGRRAAEPSWPKHGGDLGKRSTLRPRASAGQGLSHGPARHPCSASGLLVWLAYRGWSVLLLAPVAALVAAAFAGEPLLAHWTQTFMGAAARLRRAVLPAVPARRAVRQADGGQRLGQRHRRIHDGQARRRSARCWRWCWPARSSPMAASACSSPIFVLVPMARRCSARPTSPPADAGGDRPRHHDLHHVGHAGHAGHPERHPDALLRHHALRGARPRHHRLGHHARLRPVVADRAGGRRRARPAKASATTAAAPTMPPPTTRWCANAPHRRASLRPGRDADHGQRSTERPPILLAALPLVVVVVVNLLMSLLVLPRMDAGFLAEAALGRHLARRRRRRVVGGGGAGGGHRRAAASSTAGACPALRATMDAGANASVLPVFSVASLVGFGAVVAALPAFEVVRDWVLGIGGGPLVSLARRDQRAGGADRLGLGRPDHRARCARARPTWQWRPSTASTRR